MFFKNLILITVSFIVSFHSEAKEYQIEMLNSYKSESMIFKPMYLEINTGDSVRFIPTSKGHNTISYYSPEGGETWSGKTDEEIVIKFSKEGFYIYQCSNHEIMGMAGIIKVGNAKNLDSAKKAYQKLKSTFVMNQERLDTYFKE